MLCAIFASRIFSGSTDTSASKGTEPKAAPSSELVTAESRASAASRTRTVCRKRRGSFTRQARNGRAITFFLSSVRYSETGGSVSRSRASIRTT